MIAVIVIVVIFIIVIIVRSLDVRQSQRADGALQVAGKLLRDVTTPPGELAVSSYEQNALHFAQQGDFRAAIRELLLGSMSWIERAGMIRFRKGLTNRDYLRAVWNRNAQRDAYRTTANEFELIYFGRRRATEEKFQKCLTQFQGALS